MVTQAILFPIDEWSVHSAVEWLARHRKVPLKLAQEGQFYRFRLRDPRGFVRFSTRIIHDCNEPARYCRRVYLVLGYRR